jgi:hypothetical protein
LDNLKSKMNFNFRRILTSRTMAGALGVTVLLLILIFIWIEWTAPPAPVPGNFLAVLTVIPAPSSTPPIPPTATLDPNAPTVIPTPAPGQIAIGSYVQIKGTDGQGLRLRSAPGLNSDQLFLGYDSEVYLVQDGPSPADGYTWYYLVAPYEANRAGWAASDFLNLIPPP